MSWETWLSLMQNDGKYTTSHECGIYDTQGNVWAKTHCCNLTTSDFVDLNKLFNSGMESGVTSATLNGKKYIIINADKEAKTIEGKAGTAGFCAARGQTFTLVGFYNDASIQPGNNKKQVEHTKGKLAEALGQN
ncbi:profilin-1-like [Saccostrea echinata]|uniref:profilin-1-like n=1 Tax=Saccostrea echinata TaxID=191078 RepID=UPI002A7FC4F7|nr:profilin-1-like [Saccostrea echinata]